MSSPDDALADIRALVAAPNPDAPLLVACDRFMALHEEAHRIFRKRPKGYLQRIREVLHPELDALEAEIASTPARTPAGRCAKAIAGLAMVGGGGTIFRVARSAFGRLSEQCRGAGKRVR